VTVRQHVVWDWNGTLVDDLPLVVRATNAAFASVGGPAVTEAEHRRDFRRPIADYYAQVLGRPVGGDEFIQLNKVFHDVYQAGVVNCPLTADAEAALDAWSGSQSLLSMWYHNELLMAVADYGLSGRFQRIDGLRLPVAGAENHNGPYKGPFLARHLAALRLEGARVVMIGDTVDDAVAAASAGAACVLYTGGFTEAGQLRATGAPVVDTLVAAVTLARGL
jgi:phosphoglycolate phosphatase-like HAD superfamily hydrolase